MPCVLEHVAPRPAPPPRSSSPTATSRRLDRGAVRPRSPAPACTRSSPATADPAQLQRAGIPYTQLDKVPIMIRVSEFVLPGHPDKFCDAVADAIIGAC